MSAPLRLFCLPHAGGGAIAFRDWQQRLGEGIEVVALEPPGRGRRYGEPLLTSLDDIVADLVGALDLAHPGPLALFGHSMGAVVAYELARWAQSVGCSVVGLVVSGHEAPDLPHRHEPVHLLPDQDLIDHVRRLGGLPPAVAADAELMELLLPIMRADLTAIEQYVHSAQPRAAFPITALGGRDDHLVAREGLAAWGRHTEGPFRWTLLAGGHFYPDAVLDALLAQIRRAVAAPLPTGRPA